MCGLSVESGSVVSLHDSASDLCSIALVQFLNANKAENIHSVPKINLFLPKSNCEVLVLGTLKSSWVELFKNAYVSDVMRHMQKRIHL